MPRFQPFRGLRYNTDQVELDRVIAPPYDVVGDAERAALSALSPVNAIHLELPEHNSSLGLDRYQVAAHLLDTWRANRTLVQDARPAFYPYRMTTPEGDVTSGVIGALGIGEGVLPHEETMAKPKSDRLDLLRATSANLSPIWGLSLAHGLTRTLSFDAPPAAQAVDGDGVHHELWVADDGETTVTVAEVVASAPVVLADGHHRYETARTYLAEVGDRTGRSTGPHGFVMALVVELAEGQLHVKGIHRLLTGVPTGANLVDVVGRYFDMARVPGSVGDATAEIERSGSSMLVTSEGAWAMNARTSAMEAAGTDLDSGLLELALRDVEGVSVTYTASPQEGLASLLGTGADAFAIMRPVTVAQISSWAAQRRRMPAKTTYFVPKARTGMVFRDVSGET